jgi:acyl-CoA dehydrogenase
VNDRLNDASEIRAMIVESATRLFSDHSTAKVLEAAKQGDWSRELWDAAARAQLPLISIAEEAGGAGGSLSDAAAVWRVAGRYTAPIPLTETAIAGWLLASAGHPIPEGPLTFAALNEGTAVFRDGHCEITDTLKRVPWARIARCIVVLARDNDGDLVVAVDPVQCSITPGRNLAGEPRDEVALDRVKAPALPAGAGADFTSLRLRAALSRALLTAGALEAALELSVRYAGERVQFGRKIGQFQAIQHELARFAGEVAAAVACALSAAGAIDRGSEDAPLAVAAAKIRTAQAAQEGSLIAHQVHGAIGVTGEYALHHATLRLWSWREEYGNEAWWAIELGRAMAARGADELWPRLTQD